MKTFRIRVDQTVVVEVDEAKFDAAFLKEFRDSFYPFETVEEHAKHIAQLYARNMLNYAFTEGYGPLAEMGIQADTERGSMETEVAHD